MCGLHLSMDGRKIEVNKDGEVNLFAFSHLADALIQSNLHVRNTHQVQHGVQFIAQRHFDKWSSEEPVVELQTTQLVDNLFLSPEQQATACFCPVHRPCGWHVTRTATCLQHTL